MTKFSIEVRNGAARFGVALTAQSTERALELAGRLYPGREAVRVMFPRSTEDSPVGTERVQRLAA